MTQYIDIARNQDRISLITLNIFRSLTSLVCVYDILIFDSNE
jgi:hypothetical protein